MAARSKENFSLGELFSDLSTGATTLIQQEIQLAKAELSQKASRTGKDVTFLAVGGFVAYAGFLALLAALILGLAELMAAWLAALLVGVIVAAIGYLLLQKGISDLKRVSPAPQKTIETLKEDKEWAKRQIR
jgi:drug/metabolite transporter (DMT)-like permease